MTDDIDFFTDGLASRLSRVHEQWERMMDEQKAACLKIQKQELGSCRQCPWVRTNGWAVVVAADAPVKAAGIPLQTVETILGVRST